MASLPSKIGAFDIIRQIGAGGMGAVYLAHDTELDRQVAIKVIREEVHDQEVLDRFFREARAAAALRHPNIITIYACGQHEHQPFMVMEFVEGESFADIIRSRRNLPLADKLAYIEQVCAGLHFAHRAGIVHRDIKPANIMVDRHGMVRILDFGIARIEGSAMTQDGALVGSLNYMSPEQMLGRSIDFRSDIFSVGSVSYELICYQQAFKGGLTDGLLHRLPHEDPPSLGTLCPGLPANLEQVVMQALHKAPERRFHDLAAMRTALLGVQRGVTDMADDRTIIIGGSAAAPQPLTGAPLSVSSATPLGQSSVPEEWWLAAPETNRKLYQPFAEPTASAEPAEADEPSEEIAPAPESLVREQPEPRPIRRATAVAAKSDTAARRDTTVTKPPTTVSRPLPPAAARPTSSRRWILFAVVAMVAGAAVAFPFLKAAVPLPKAAGAPFLKAEPPNPLEVQRPGIDAAMERYRGGYRNRDLAAVTAVFPALPPQLKQEMQKTFASCLLYEVVFADMAVMLTSSDNAHAEVDVRSTHTCTPQSGGYQTTRTQRDVFTLEKQGDSWLITGVRAAASASADRP